MVGRCVKSAMLKMMHTDHAMRAIWRIDNFADVHATATTWMADHPVRNPRKIDLQ